MQTEEKNVKMSSHFETYTRKTRNGFELRNGKGRGDRRFGGIHLI